MGLVALGVMWVNTLLIAATVASAATEARRRRRSLIPLGLALAGCTGMLSAAIGVSALALTRPYFGSWSILPFADHDWTLDFGPCTGPC